MGHKLVIRGNLNKTAPSL